MAVLTIGFLMLGARAASADDWSSEVSYRYSQKTSLKITGTKGLTVAVTAAGGVVRDTIPAIVPLPNEDAFVPVTVTAKDGTKWSDKVEIRANQQAHLAITYTAPVKAAPKAKTRDYIGNVGNLAKSSCGKKHAATVKFEFIRKSDGANAGAIELADGKAKSFTLTGATYDVRLYRKGSYITTKSLEIKADDWKVVYGCQRGKRGPRLIVVK